MILQNLIYTTYSFFYGNHQNKKTMADLHVNNKANAYKPCL